MPIEYIAKDMSGSGVQIERSFDDQDLSIISGTLVRSYDDRAIYCYASYHDVTIHGQVQAAIYGIVLGNEMTNDAFNSVTIVAGGSVYADVDAIRFKSAFGRVVNNGEIHAVGDGTLGGSDGIVLGGIGTGTSQIVNHGLIEARDQGVEVNDGTTETVVLKNYGTISGHNDAYVGDINVDVVINRGTIQGNIYLKEGDDFYDGRSGKVRGGSINGGDGNDTFLPGRAAETINGNSDHDTLDFRNGGGLRVSLADSSGTGAAAGDTYHNMERVLGSRTGADTLIGSSSDNMLYGNGNNDALLGGAGDDLLDGGSGNDRLQGGLDRDRLVGGRGSDTADFSDKSFAVVVTLNGASWAPVRVGGTIEDTLRGIENLQGGRAGDRLTGDAQSNRLLGGIGGDTLRGGSGADWLDGGFGSDTLSGGAGQDVLIGGDGRDLLRGGSDGSMRDVFVFTSRSHSVVGANRDTVAHFRCGVDDIDLDRIDANAFTVSTNEDFTWSGTTPRAHSVWWQATTGGVLLRLDVNGNTTADFEVLLKGLTSFGSTDVLL